MTIKKQSAILHTRALFSPSTLDSEKRTVDVVFATAKPVKRYSKSLDDYYFEVLDMNGANLERAERGLPVLDNHNAYSSVANSIIGRAENIRREGDQWVATIRFSEREELIPLINDIKDGIITDISFGYSVEELERGERLDADKYSTYYVRRWTPSEISFVTIPADPASGVRSADGNNFEPELFFKHNELIMRREQIIAMLQKRGVNVPEGATDAELQDLLERNLAPNKPADPEKPAVPNEDETRSAATAAERARTKEIFDLAKRSGLGDDFAKEHIDAATSIDEVRRLAIDKMARKDETTAPRIGVIGSGLDQSARREAATTALLKRINPAYIKDVEPDVLKAADQYRNASLMDMVRYSLEAINVDVRGMDQKEMIKRAITQSGSDFPVLLGDTVNRVLLAEYNIVSDTWSRLCSVSSVSDFKTYKRLKTGTLKDLQVIGDTGEFQNAKITDADFEQVSIGTFGMIVNLSRKAIINDDLGGFLRLAQQAARAAARTIENNLYALLASNPTLQDGQALFHATHGNIAGTASAPTSTSVDLARQQMAMQQDKDSNDYLDIRPAIAWSPLSLGSKFRILNTSAYDPDASNKLQAPNVVNGMFNDVVDTPRLSGTAWYVLADPNVEPVFDVAFLNGERAPYIEQQEGFEVDGMRWKIRHDFGVNVVGFRGIVKNAGA